MPASVQLAVRIAASVAFQGIQRCIDHLLTRPLSHTAAVNVRFCYEGAVQGVKWGVKGGDVTLPFGAHRWTSHAYGVV